VMIPDKEFEKFLDMSTYKPTSEEDYIYPDGID